MTGLRLIFMGTPDFAVDTLKVLAASQHKVVAVYTQPPRPADRGMTPKKSPVQIIAEIKSIPVLTPKNFKDAKDVKAFKDLKADLAVVAAYGLLLPEAVLNEPKLGCINIHASLLPRWRGASPIQYAILYGDKESGISIMQMEKGLDTGPVLVQKVVSLTPSETADTLHDKLAKLAAHMIVPTIDALAAGKLEPQRQNDSEAMLAPKIGKDEGEIDWCKGSFAIERKVRAFTPAPGAWFKWEGRRIRILNGTTVSKTGTPGEVLDENLLIACGKDAYRILRLQREGKKAMSAAEFLRGTPVPKGTKL